MSFGQIVTRLGLGVLLGLISGIITRNLFVAFAFPFLLFAFYLIWKSFKDDLKGGIITVEEKKEDRIPTVREELQNKQEENQTTDNRPTEV